MLIAVCGVLGLLVGSFLNVVVARVPVDRSVVSPPSACPRCDTPIAPRDNVPVVSWLLLRGRARCCGEPVSVRYPLVEAGTAVAFALVGWWLGWVAVLPAFLFLAAISIALALIDIDTFRLPYVIVARSYPVAAVLLGAASLAARDTSSVVRMLAGGAVLWLFYRLLHAVYPQGMGYGDVRLAGVLGMYLGWLGWSELVTGAFFAFLVGGLAGIAIMVVGRGSLKTQIPYGPYMIVGAWLGAVWGADVAGAYLRAAGLA
ncbi:A24 family peptidase [Kineosporia sp. A_224]|uniref:prepilin peptidase n=1 Tax=Kineosporia sp. A_224 TaxID=1962180 RepID=UPI000B4B31CB|nr:A24 family peptidase [Kineosporia sp. A_224]